MFRSPLEAPELLRLGPLLMHRESVIMSAGVTVFLLLLAFVATRRMSMIPGRLQSVVEMIVELTENMVKDNIGENGLVYLPFFATLLFYIFFANMMGLVPGLKSPTADINFAMGLAVAVMITMQYVSIRAHGFFGWIKHFFQPSFPFVVIHLLELVTRPLTLALRLFGNIFAGEVLIFVLYSLAPVLVPSLWLALSVLIGGIQAYIFAVLSMAYTGTSVSD